MQNSVIVLSLIIYLESYFVWYYHPKASLLSYIFLLLTNNSYFNDSKSILNMVISFPVFVKKAITEFINSLKKFLIASRWFERCLCLSLVSGPENTQFCSANSLAKCHSRNLHILQTVQYGISYPHGLQDNDL